MTKLAANLFWIVGLLPIAGQTAYVCTDNKGATSVQDRPCPEKVASSTNVPLKATELSDGNSIETVNRFYKAMMERDPEAASRFLSDSFTSEVRRPNKPVAKDTKASMAAGLRQVLSAAKTYNAQVKCQIVSRTPAAFSLACEVEEEGVVMNKSHRTHASQSITVVLTNGFVQIGRIVSETR